MSDEAFSLGELNGRVMHLAARDDATPLLIMAVQDWITEAVEDMRSGVSSAAKNPGAADEEKEWL